MNDRGRLPRVALVYDVLYPWVRGGAEKRFWEIARRLSRFGFEPHLLGPKYWDGPRSIQKEGVWLHGICPPRPLYTPQGTRTISEALAYAGDLLPALTRLRVDLIDSCAFPYFPWFSTRAIAALRGIPILTTWPEVWGPYWRSYLGPFPGTVAQIIEATTVCCSQTHLCLSPFTARRLQALAPGHPHITSLPAGIDYNELVRYATPSSERQGILFVGRLLAHKRVADLLQAAALVWHRRGPISITIVGTGPEESTLRTLAIELGLSDHVTFYSNLEDAALYRLFGSTRCLVLPSEREGQGIVVAEAQAIGTPPIVACGPDTAAVDFVRHGHNGMTYAVGDLPALADVLFSVLHDDSLYDTLVHGAYETARTLDWDTAILPHIAALYGNLLTGREAQ